MCFGHYTLGVPLSIQTASTIEEEKATFYPSKQTSLKYLSMRLTLKKYLKSAALTTLTTYLFC